ncbi:MAG: RhuM family protein, partial [Burkholderiales bacterium]
SSPSTSATCSRRESWTRSQYVENLHILLPPKKMYEVEFYNLDAILSAGCRVSSKRGTRFRIWATGY